MKALAFAPCGASATGRHLRSARFEERSSLPTSAACVVASGVRETLAALFGVAVSARLLEPAVPSPQAWAAIARNALLYRVRGSITDAAIVLRRTDAAALASAAFGEDDGTSPAERELSPLEADVLERAAAAMAATLGAVCGTHEREPLERVATIGGFATYFEVLLERPVRAHIGIALSRDPAPEPYGRLTIDDLADVTLAPVVTLEMGRIRAGALAELRPGAIVPMTRANGLRGRLTLRGRTLARGTCGVRRGRYALALEA